MGNGSPQAADFLVNITKFKLLYFIEFVVSLQNFTLLKKQEWWIHFLTSFSATSKSNIKNVKLTVNCIIGFLNEVESLTTSGGQTPSWIELRLTFFWSRLPSQGSLKKFRKRGSFRGKQVYMRYWSQELTCTLQAHRESMPKEHVNNKLKKFLCYNTVLPEYLGRNLFIQCKL